MLTLNATIEEWNSGIYIGNVHEMKGLVVQSDSIQGVMEEILISVRVKLAFDSGLDISKVISVKKDTKNITFEHIEANNYMFAL